MQNNTATIEQKDYPVERTANEYLMITFNSTHQAIRFERILLPLYNIELIPTPREVSASCGLSLKFEKADTKRILETLKQEKKEGIQLYRFIISEENKQVQQLNWED